MPIGLGKPTPPLGSALRPGAPVLPLARHARLDRSRANQVMTLALALALYSTSTFSLRAIFSTSTFSGFIYS